MSDEMDERLVYLVAYGAALSSARFACLLHGGRAVGAISDDPGCDDTRPVDDDRAVLIDRALVFGGRTPRWGGAGVAWLDPEPDAGAGILGRAWRVHGGQCRDLLRQLAGVDDLDLDLNRLAIDGRIDQRGAVLLQLGALDGVPLLTVTRDEVALGPPSEDYLGHLIAGLRETFNLSRQGARKYLKDRPGIRGHLSGGAIERMWTACVC